MSDTPNLAPNECECAELLWLREQYEYGVLQRDPAWRTATHGDCGYCEPFHSLEFICLRTGKSCLDYSKDACPAYCGKEDV